MSMIGSTKKANELIKNHHDEIKDSANYVYMLKSEGNVVYVGKTRSIRTRLANHVSDKHFDSFSVIECAERNMDEIEVHYIKKHTPKYNKKDNPEYRKSQQADNSHNDTNKELKNIVQTSAEDKGITGVMKLNELCTELSYERVSKVWHGNTSAKFSDVEYVLGVIGIKLRWSA